jgi:hypothetical protein
VAPAIANAVYRATGKRVRDLPITIEKVLCLEVDAKEIRIMGCKSELLRTFVAASGVKTASFGVPSFVPKWRAIQNKTANSYVIEIAM